MESLLDLIFDLIIFGGGVKGEGGGGEGVEEEGGGRGGIGVMWCLVKDA